MVSSRLLIGLVLLSLAVSVAEATRRSETEQYEVRRTANANAIHFESRYKDSDSREVYKFDVNNDPSPRLAARYDAKEGKEKTKAQLRVLFHDIIEYTEEGAADSGFDPEEDTIVNTVDLSEESWSSLASACSDVQVNGVDVTECVLDNSPSPTFLLRIRISDAAFDTDSGERILPDTVQWNVEIPNWTYADPGNFLAIRVGVRAREKLRNLGARRGTAGNPWTELSGSTLSFSWSDTATDDADDTFPVHSSALETDDNTAGDEGQEFDNPNRGKERLERVVFSFLKAGATGIVWDPSLGQTSMNLVLIIGGVGAAVVLVAVVGIGASRRRNK